MRGLWPGDRFKRKVEYVYGGGRSAL